MKKVALIVLLISLLTLPAMAGTDYNICFSRIDSDYDGEVTKAEFESAFPGGDTAVFAAADTDGSGAVNHDEWEAYKSSQGFEEGENHG